VQNIQVRQMFRAEHTGETGVSFRTYNRCLCTVHTDERCWEEREEVFSSAACNINLSDEMIN
jgi:hypothetical protein